MQEVPRTISCSIGVLLMASCASYEATTRVNVAEAELKSLRDARMMVFFELVDSSNLSEEQRAAEENRTFEALGPVCVKTYAEQLGGAIDHATQVVTETGSRDPIVRLASYAEALDRFFVTCIAEYGVRGYNYMEASDGRELRLPDYIRSFIASAEYAHQAQLQVVHEEQQNTMIFSAIALGLGAGLAGSGGSHSVNLDRVYIDNYRKYDGTYVQGHWRTVPNYTCLDNINGC